ncbi:hypothetical protein F5877DRAFT_84333 [Lentinula edodes]|nr:hypothetical protein F5877DRAFT_84333 [Lentinula edodes]
MNEEEEPAHHGVYAPLPRASNILTHSWRDSSDDREFQLQNPGSSSTLRPTTSDIDIDDLILGLTTSASISSTTDSQILRKMDPVSTPKPIICDIDSQIPDPMDNATIPSDPEALLTQMTTEPIMSGNEDQIPAKASSFLTTGRFEPQSKESQNNPHDWIPTFNTQYTLAPIRGSDGRFTSTTLSDTDERPTMEPIIRSIGSKSDFEDLTPLNSPVKIFSRQQSPSPSPATRRQPQSPTPDICRRPMATQQPLARFSGDPDDPVQPATFLQDFELVELSPTSSATPELGSAKGAEVEKTKRLIGTVWKNLPYALKKTIYEEHDTWVEFTNTIKKVKWSVLKVEAEHEASKATPLVVPETPRTKLAASFAAARIATPPSPSPGRT